MQAVGSSSDASDAPKAARTPKRADALRTSPTKCSPIVAAAVAEPDSIGELHSVTLLDEDELAPLEAPQLDIKSAAVLLSSEHWHEQFAGIDLMRRLARHHAAILDPALRDTVPALATAAASLRTALARNAMRCAGELCRALPGGMAAPDVDLGPLVLELLARAASDKRFIRDVSTAALKALGTSCATRRVAALCVLRAPDAARRPESRAQTAVLLVRALRAAGPAFLRGLARGGEAAADAATGEGAAVPTADARIDSSGEDSCAAGADADALLRSLSLPRLVCATAEFVQGRTATERRAGTEVARLIARATGADVWKAEVASLSPQNALALRRATTTASKGKARVPLRERIMKQRQSAAPAAGLASVEILVR